MSPKSLLFLCTGNSCRSQMAEGWAKERFGNQYQILSAGTDPHGLNPYAVKSMAAAGIDISKQTSNHLDEYMDQEVSVVFAVCDHAAQNCPRFPGTAKIVRHQFDDPPKLAEGETAESAKLLHYNRVRDEIKEWIYGLEL